VIKRVAVLGDRDPAHLTHRAIDAALELFPTDIAAAWLATDSPEATDTEDLDGLWIAPGTPYRNDDCVYGAITTARLSHQPLLATCGGFQYAAVEFARNALKRRNAAHAETEPEAIDLVVVPLACSLVGEERTVQARPGSRLASICGTEQFTGFHWCNYGVAAHVLEAFEEAGLHVSATADDAGAEALELEGHPFFIATLFQPQVEVLNGKGLHPLIGAFMEAVQQAS
jgi:CTP synthase (UTP-ammonia lyase)